MIVPPLVIFDYLLCYGFIIAEILRGGKFFFGNFCHVMWTILFMGKRAAGGVVVGSPVPSGLRYF